MMYDEREPAQVAYFAEASRSRTKRPSVVDEIVDAFRQDLLSGKMQPGDRLPAEPELAERFQVGRGTVREAVKVLQALGVVKVIRGDGTRIVTEPPAALIDPLVFAMLLGTRLGSDLIELRALIEVGYCQLAAQKMTPSDMASIEAAQAAYERYAAEPARDLDRQTELDLVFHDAVMEATHNELIVRVAKTIERLYHTSIRRTMSPAGLDWGVKAHRNIISALRENNPERIRTTVIESLGFWAQELRDSGDGVPR
jgi:GntR family transcriptional regulator, transcriptional repressor for pyruvate dehydrogenase complex